METDIFLICLLPQSPSCKSKGKKKVSDTRFPLESDGPPKAMNDPPLVSYAPFFSELPAVTLQNPPSSFRSKP